MAKSVGMKPQDLRGSVRALDSTPGHVKGGEDVVTLNLG